MRISLAIISLCLVFDTVNAQLLDPSVSPLNKGTVTLVSKVPAKLTGDATISFDYLDIVFDGGSYVARFVRDNGQPLNLFFAHSGYWTKAARMSRTQAVAVLTYIAGKQALVEIKRDSPLQTRLVELITADLSNGKRKAEDRATLTRIRDCIRDRKPLREIEERMDPKTSELTIENEPFVDPFDDARTADEPSIEPKPTAQSN